MLILMPGRQALQKIEVLPWQSQLPLCCDVTTQGLNSTIEVLARGGGLKPNYKAYNIKIIRGDLKNPTVVTVDLSTIEGLTKAELNMQSGDIVYIDFRRKFVTDALKEASIVLSLVTSVTSSVVLIQTLSSR